MHFGRERGVCVSCAGSDLCFWPLDRARTRLRGFHWLRSRAAHRKTEDESVTCALRARGDSGVGRRVQSRHTQRDARMGPVARRRACLSGGWVCGAGGGMCSCEAVCGQAWGCREVKNARRTRAVAPPSRHERGEPAQAVGCAAREAGLGAGWQRKGAGGGLFRLRILVFAGLRGERRALGVESARSEVLAELPVGGVTDDPQFPRRPKRLVVVTQGHRGRPAAGSPHRTLSKFTSTRLHRHHSARAISAPYCTSLAALEPLPVHQRLPARHCCCAGGRRSAGCCAVWRCWPPSCSQRSCDATAPLLGHRPRHRSGLARLQRRPSSRNLVIWSRPASTGRPKIG